MKLIIPTTHAKDQNEANYSTKYLSSTVVALLILIAAMTGCKMNENTSLAYLQVPHAIVQIAYVHNWK